MQAVEKTGTLFEQLSAEELIGVKTVLGAYRSLRGPRREMIGYISMPITSGKRLNRLLVENNVRYLPQLSEKRGGDFVYGEVIRPNIDSGITFADRRGALDNLLYIAPSVFEAKKWRWSQDAYMALWYQVIAELAGRHILMDGWQYSNGCIQEVFFSLLLQHGAFSIKDMDKAKRCFELDLNYQSARNELEAMRFQRITVELEAISKITIHDDANQVLTAGEVLAKLADAVYELVELCLPFRGQLGPALGILYLPKFLHDFNNVGLWTLGDEGDPDYDRMIGILERGRAQYGSEIIDKLYAGVHLLKKRKTGGYPDNCM